MDTIHDLGGKEGHGPVAVTREEPPFHEPWEGRGDCVACNQCIAVCPTGIDIRDGNQLECSGCGLCIDACNHIMARVGRPANLITYDSMARQTAEAAGKTAHYRLVRPRTLFYLGLLLIVGGFIVYGLWSRPGVEINVLRDRSPLFVTLSDGSIRNGYTLKILNKAREPRAYTLALDGLPNATVTVVGRDAPETIVQLSAAPDAVTTYRLYVRAPSGDLDGKSTPFAFVLQPNPRTPDTPVSRRDVVFRGPDT